MGLYDFYQIDRKPLEALTAQEYLDNQNNAMAVFKNPIFQQTFKEFHADTFQALTVALASNDYQTADKLHTALVKIEELYHRFDMGEVVPPVDDTINPIV